MQHKKKISDQVSVRAHRGDKEWKYQKKSVAGGLVCKLARVQSGRAEAVVTQRSKSVLYL